MKQISHDDMTRNSKVYYRYDKTTSAPVGPFTVQGFYRNHEGKHVTLRNEDGEDRTVLLATDEDFGAPLFYTP